MGNSLVLLSYTLISFLVIIYLLDLLFFHVYLKCHNMSTYQYIMGKRAKLKEL
jgi:hypothetical protein